ncbi:hypothetical protein CAEBREN_05167 [Caenorhabditis brenneri]|uniref:F-box domain-containing protein n=1 Tax=Caenorhabditis brenneri TaxID=135651 RepID=G0P9H9_CAEBE|nr:hypothetical protein CAEBREN_05167 [Caenorhabditis brenneri]
MVSLINMPDLVMRNIFEHCDIQSVMRIRGVCRKFRDYIDDSSFKTTIHSISVRIFPTQIDLVLGNWMIENNERVTHQSVIQYHYDYSRDYEDNCLMKCMKDGYSTEEVKKVLKNQNYVNKFSDDLERILRVNGSILITFSVRFAECPNGFTIQVEERCSSLICRMFGTIFHHKIEKTLIVSPDDIKEKETKIWTVIVNSFKQRQLKTDTLQISFPRGRFQIVEILENLDPITLTRLEIVSFWENGFVTIGYGAHIGMEKYDKSLSQWLHKYYTNPKVDSSSELYKWVKEYFI